MSLRVVLEVLSVVVLCGMAIVVFLIPLREAALLGAAVVGWNAKTAWEIILGRPEAPV